MCIRDRCSPCQGLSDWLSSGDYSNLKKNRWWKDEYAIIYDRIQNDEILFITILFEDEMREPANYKTVSNWHEKYPNNKINDKMFQIQKQINNLAYGFQNKL